MKIHFVFVGKTVFPEMQRGIDRYLERLGHYVRVEVHVVRPERVGPKADEKVVLEKEGRRIADLVSGRGVLIVWDEKGKALSSPEYANVIQHLHHGGHEVWMVLGGPLGLSQDVKRAAHHMFALSAMTFPHDLARLLVAEQTYRAMTILRGEPYQKS